MKRNVLRRFSLFPTFRWNISSSRWNVRCFALNSVECMNGKLSRQKRTKASNKLFRNDKSLPKSSADQRSIRRFSGKSGVTSLGWTSFDLPSNVGRAAKIWSKYWKKASLTCRQKIQVARSAHCLVNFQIFIRKSVNENWLQTLLLMMKKLFCSPRLPNNFADGCFGLPPLVLSWGVNVV